MPCYIYYVRLSEKKKGSTDTRGKRVDASINGSNFGILNWDSPTRVPPNAEPSSPDVSLASASLITSCSWQTLSTLSSDHLPILIRLQMKTTSIPGLRRTYVNLKKADWDRYRQEVETAPSKRSLPTDCQRDEKIFRAVLLKAALHHIPTGRQRLHEEPVPAEILDVMTRRDDLRKRDPTSPELPRLNYNIQNHIYAHKTQKWRYFVETLDQKTDVTKLWRTIKGIDGRAKRKAENEAITFNGISFSSSKQLATKFNQQFNTSKLGRHTSSSETRLVTRETKRKSLEMAQTSTTDLVRTWSHLVVANNNSNHGIHIRYQDNLTDRPKMTTSLQTPHKHTDPTVKVREISSYCRYNHKHNQKQTQRAQIAYSRYMHISSPFRKPSS